jgi:hypothetical protein
MPPIVHEIKTEGRWTRDALARELPGRLVKPATLEVYLGRPPIFTARR